MGGASRRWRCDLVAPPMPGHLHRTLGVAVRLAREPRLAVRVVSTGAAGPATAASGLQGVCLMRGADEEIRSIVEPARAVRSHPGRLLGQFRSHLALLARLQAELEELWSAPERRPDLVLADFAVPVAGAVATRHGIPWWTLLPSPSVLETADGPPGYVGGWLPRDTALGRLRDRLGRGGVRAFKRMVFTLHRRSLRSLGFTAPYREDGSEAIYSADRIYGLVWPELEFPRTWPAALRLIGPVLYTPPTAVVPPPFLEGRRHVLVGCGSHLPWHRRGLQAAAAAAARRLPDVEFHLSGGWSETEETSGAAPEELPPNLHLLPTVSYAEHLARYALVVHHAGAGIAAFTVAAGLPAIVLPVDYDQFDVAARLAAAGLARRVRGLRELPEAIAAGLEDGRLAATVRAFRERVRAAEPAVERVARDVLAEFEAREKREEAAG